MVLHIEKDFKAQELFTLLNSQTPKSLTYSKVIRDLHNEDSITVWVRQGQSFNDNASDQSSGIHSRHISEAKHEYSMMSNTGTEKLRITEAT